VTRNDFPGSWGEDFPSGLTAQPLAKHVSGPIHFLGGERSEPPHEVSYADGLDLLEVERSGLRNGLGKFNSQRLPLTAVVCGRTVTIANSSSAG
jgi:hypothetical protein